MNLPAPTSIPKKHFVIDKCTTCAGTKYKTVKKIISVEIPVGIMDGESITIESMSDEGVE